MSHVDQGILHAYLDGALDELPSGDARAIREHLAACPECRALLEEEEGIREQTLAILAGPLPEVELPPLEELRLRAEATSPPRASRGRRIQHMGWAASVILAIGAGYALRGDQVIPLGTMDAIDGPNVPWLEPPPAEAGPATVLDASANDLLRQAVQQSDARADRAASAQRERRLPNSVIAISTERSVLKAPADGDVAVSTAGSVVAEVDSGDPLAAELLRALPLEKLVALDVVTLQDRLLGVPAQQPLASSLLDLTSVAATTKRLSGGLSVPAVRAIRFANEDLDEGRVARRGRVAMASASRAAAAPAFSTSDASLRPRERRPSARRGGAEGQLVVPGFELISLENIEEGPAAGGLRTLQRLTQVDTLELLHLPEGVVPGDLAAAEQDGIVQHAAFRNGEWLVMRAPRSKQELEVLLERLDANR
jgi:anti-sigma factor RsiW